jgi:hypothetical protein
MTESLHLAGMAPEEQAAFLAFSAKVQGTNINPQTLLATDYLNHFNEIVMLLEMVPDMPDCFEDVQAWQPKSYQDHFHDSQFRDRDLAVEAYGYVPAHYRQPFEDIISQINLAIAATVGRIGALLESGESEELARLCGDASKTVQKMMDIASAIIHGSVRRFDQIEIDGLLGR